MNALAVLYAALTGLWLVLRRLTGDRPWWLQLVNELTPMLLAPSALVLLVSLLRRSPSGIVAALIPATTFLSLYRQRFSAKQCAPGAAPRLRLMTLNMLCRRRPAAKTVQAIRESSADIVLLQEVLPEMAAALERELLADYPYQALYPATRARGMAVFSRIRFEHEEKFQLISDGWYCQELRIRWGGGRLALFNVHLLSPIKGNRKFGQRPYDSSLRAKEMGLLIERVKQIDDCDVIVAGDFNTTDQCPEYRAMREYMCDAYLDAGAGMGFTFPAHTPHAKYWYERHAPAFLRIDHVFYRGRLRPISARVGPNGDSDHHSLVVDIGALVDERTCSAEPIEKCDAIIATRS